MTHREQFVRPLGRAGAVEGGGEREPAAGRVAERRGLAERVDRGLGAIRKHRTGGSEADRDRTGRDDVAADRRAHVVAAARADRNPRVQPERLGSLTTQRADNADGWRGRWERALPIASLIDRAEHDLAVTPRPNVEVGGARRVAVFGHELAGQPEVQIVVRQAHPRGPRVRLRLVCGEPRDLRRGVPRKHEVAHELENSGLAAELSRQLNALRGRRRVVPELRRPHRSIALIQTHQTVLLAGHADATDLESLAADGVAYGIAQRVDPPCRVLLARSIVALHDFMGSAADRDDLAPRLVAEHDFCRLRAAVDAEKDPAHARATARRTCAARGPTRPYRRSNRACGP